MLPPEPVPRSSSEDSKRRSERPDLTERRRSDKYDPYPTSSHRDSSHRDSSRRDDRDERRPTERKEDHSDRKKRKEKRELKLDPKFKYARPIFPYKFLQIDYENKNKRNLRQLIITELSILYQYYLSGNEEMKLSLNDYGLNTDELRQIIDLLILNRMNLVFTKFSLTDNCLTEVPDNLKYFINLKKLDLSRNQLRGFQKVFCKLPKCLYYVNDNPDFAIMKDNESYIHTIFLHRVFGYLKRKKRVD